MKKYRNMKPNHNLVINFQSFWNIRSILYNAICSGTESMWRMNRHINHRHDCLHGVGGVRCGHPYCSTVKMIHILFLHLCPIPKDGFRSCEWREPRCPSRREAQFKWRNFCHWTANWKAIYSSANWKSTKQDCPKGWKGIHLAWSEDSTKWLQRFN